MMPAFVAAMLAIVGELETVEFEGVPFRVVGADYLAVIALSVGRAKDFTRILALLEAESVTSERIASLAQRHSLADAWNHFKTRFLNE